MQGRNHTPLHFYFRFLYKILYESEIADMIVKRTFAIHPCSSSDRA